MTHSVKVLPFRVDSNDCHIYTLTARDKAGYSRVRIGDKLMYGHVYNFIQAHGPVPDGMEVMHAKGCRKDCINPAHLTAGTHAQNMADIKEHKKDYCPHGHELSLTNSYRWNNKTLCKICKALRADGRE